MFIAKPDKLALTLVFSIGLALALAGTSDAKGFASESAHRRDHVDLNRMIKKRSPFPQRAGGDDSLANFFGGPAAANAAAADPPPPDSASPSNSASSAPPSSSAPASSQPASSAPPSSSPAPTPAPNSQSASSSQPGSSTGLLDSLINGLTNTTSSSPSSTQASSSTPATTSSANTASLNFSPAPSLSNSATDQVTVTSQVPGASSTSGADNQQDNTKSPSLSHTALTIIIVLASSIGGIAIIWTLIRKWKFRPSSQFEDRMQPIDWKPSDHDSGVPGLHRGASTASSFHSAGHDGTSVRDMSDSGHGHGPAPLNPIPDHDFTAGPSMLAPVGGYADLARGPSPQPQMQPQMQEPLGRGPSLTRGYDQYGVPLHHQGAYTTQNAYDYNGASGY